MAITAGKEVRIKVQSDSTLAATGEAFTLVSGLKYKVTDRNKVLWDDTQTITVYDNAVPVSTSDYEINPLSGVVIFNTGYTVAGAITADFNYYTSSTIAFARTGDLSQTVDIEEITTFADADTDQLAGLAESKRKLPLLETATGTVGGFYDPDDNFSDILATGQDFILQYQADVNTQSSIIYVKVKFASSDAAFDIEAVNTSDLSWEATAPLEFEPA